MLSMIVREEIMFTNEVTNEIQLPIGQFRGSNQ